jgi:hypothetical protein
VAKIHTSLDIIEAHYFKDAFELQARQEELKHILKAKGQMESARKFVVRLGRLEKSVQSVSLQGAMRESNRIMQDILQADLPTKFRQSVTTKCDNIQNTIKLKLQEQLNTSCLQVEQLELQVGINAFDHV